MSFITKASPFQRQCIFLAVLLAVYLTEVVGFASAYKAIHERDQTAFVFNSAIVERQKALDSGELEKLLENTLTELHALSVAKTFPSFIRSAPEPAAYRIPRVNRVLLRYERENIELTIAFTIGELKENGELSITDKTKPDWQGFNVERKFNPPEKFYEGNGFETSPEASADVAEEFSFLIDEELSRLQIRKTDIQRQIAELDANGPRWQFTEYLYFSVIVLGGGSGDIIPNSHHVRQCVILQYFISVILVGFLINVTGLIGQRRSETKTLGGHTS